MSRSNLRPFWALVYFYFVWVSQPGVHHTRALDSQDSAPAQLSVSSGPTGP